MAKLVFHLVWAFLAAMIKISKLESSISDPEIGSILANVGNAVILPCPYTKEFTRLYWYKQTLGQIPKLICSVYKYDKIGHFHNEFKNDQRFTSTTDVDRTYLEISNVRVSDTATYYCASSFTFLIDFVAGMSVKVKDQQLDNKISIQQITPETSLPGMLVTLNCTVHTGTCDKKQSIYWFKQTETNSIGLVQIPENQCERTPESQTHLCFYNVTMDSRNQTPPGTYHCAMLSCGPLLFGNSTRVDSKDDVKNVLMMYIWSAASALTSFLSVLVAASAYLMNKRKPCPCQDSLTSALSKKRNENKDSVYYNVVREIQVKKSKSQWDETWSRCVYLSVIHEGGMEDFGCL